MDQIYQWSVFGHLNQEIISNLFKLDVQAKCIFTKQLDPENSQNFIHSQDPIILEIRGEYVLETIQKEPYIIGGFKCSPQIKFQIIKSTIKPFQSQKTPIGIAFIFKHPSHAQFCFGIDYTAVHSFLHFHNILQTKYIIQLKFLQNFKPIRRLGKGVSGCVYQGLRIRDKKHFAIKSLKKQLSSNPQSKFSKQRILKEFEILNISNHKNICKLYGVYQTEHSVYMIMELLEANLHNFMMFNFQKIDIKFVKKTMKQLLQGLYYLKMKNIVHRDIKLQNILLRKLSEQEYQPVISDFGLAEYSYLINNMYCCGTPGYIAPQLINISPLTATNQINYRKETSDMFSLGVVFHILLFGKMLFTSTDFLNTFQKNKQCEINKIGWEILNPSTYDLLNRMLHKDPKERITPEQALQHQYFK